MGAANVVDMTQNKLLEFYVQEMAAIRAEEFS